MAPSRWAALPPDGMSAVDQITTFDTQTCKVRSRRDLPLSSEPRSDHDIPRPAGRHQVWLLPQAPLSEGSLLSWDLRLTAQKFFTILAIASRGQVGPSLSSLTSVMRLPHASRRRELRSIVSNEWMTRRLKQATAPFNAVRSPKRPPQVADRGRRGHPPAYCRRRYQRWLPDFR